MNDAQRDYLDEQLIGLRARLEGRQVELAALPTDETLGNLTAGEIIALLDLVYRRGYDRGVKDVIFDLLAMDATG